MCHLYIKRPIVSNSKISLFSVLQARKQLLKINENASPFSLFIIYRRGSGTIFIGRRRQETWRYYYLGRLRGRSRRLWTRRRRRLGQHDDAGLCFGRLWRRKSHFRASTIDLGTESEGFRP